MFYALKMVNFALQSDILASYLTFGQLITLFLCKRKKPLFE